MAIQIFRVAPGHVGDGFKHTNLGVVGKGPEYWRADKIREIRDKL